MAALAHEMPIISTYPQVEVAEIMEDRNMALVPPDDVEALAGKIAWLAASPSVRGRLRRGAAELSELFSWETIAERTMRVYQEVLEEHT